ncbi:hypothetical protein ENH_00024240 [Eimeria necatrix]|uniref:Uncharacterized protein n=1 Tax=Eimeria necatrix TaxID=51315 RepID=U6MJV5_9EIME|nr:hypothetical protein ENH_00024240 [Eimeria necatrix]CDJ62734.1 hypothetical protein ENH_00024240 [Eimeria necatrix]
MVVMRMQNVSKERRELWDADAPQSKNADVQVVAMLKGRALGSWEADHESGEPRSLVLLRASLVCHKAVIHVGSQLVRLKLPLNLALIEPIWS